MKEKKHLTFDSVDLAVPEIHVHSVSENPPKEVPADSDSKVHLNVKYDNVAVPEIVSETAKCKDIPAIPAEHEE